MISKSAVKIAILMGSLASGAVMANVEDALVSDSDVGAYCSAILKQSQLRSGFATSGNFFTSTLMDGRDEKSLVSGYSKNLLGNRSSRVIEDIAGYDCAVKRNTVIAEKIFTELESKIDRDVLGWKIGELTELLADIEKDVSAEKDRVASQVSTIGDLRQISDLRDRAVNDLLQAEEALAGATNTTPLVYLRTSDYVKRAEEAFAASVSLKAKLESLSTETLVVSAGAKQRLDNGGKTSPYVSIAYTYNFGAFGSSSLIDDIRYQSARVFAESKDGISARYTRSVKMLNEYLVASKKRVTALNDRLGERQAYLAKVSLSSSTLSKKSARMLEIELKLIKIETGGLQRRIDLAQRWLDAQ